MFSHQHFSSRELGGVSLLVAMTLFVSITVAGVPTKLEPDWHGRMVGVNTAADPDSCDFVARTCKIPEGDLLNFDISFSQPTLPCLPFCVFADPRTLPPGATFPAQTGMGMVGSHFEWTPHECQAGEYIVHFHASFFCFDLFFAGIFPVTIVVNDAVDCPVTGACCLPDGSCEDLSEEECAQREGGFTPDAACSVVAGPGVPPLCFPRLGACCRADGTCVPDVTVDLCELREQGEFMGDGTSCDDVSCTGACSTINFSCVDDRSRNQCEQSTLNGQFRGAETTCKDTPLGSGACCFPDGTCVHLPHERDCKSRLGTFQGSGTLCAGEGGDVTCPVTGGSCCHDPGCEGTPFTGCMTVDATRCGLNGGTMVTADPCSSPTKCPPAMGACCFLDTLNATSGGGPFCVDGRTFGQCVDSGGQYLGNGSRCGDDDNDGVDNCCDQCPNTAPGEPVAPCDFGTFFAGVAGCSCRQNELVCGGTPACYRVVCNPGADDANALGCTYRRIPGCCGTDADCDDNDACTLDLCIQNVCTHSGITCQDDEIRCTIDRCHSQLGCNWPNHTLCDDRDPCTANFCNPAVGGSGCETFPVDCNDDVPCTRDECFSAQGGCVNSPVDERCDDGDPCTINVCDPNHPQALPDGCLDTPRRGLLVCGDGDFNKDGVRDLNDLTDFVACLNLGGPGMSVDVFCAAGDLDGNGVVDLDDVRHHQRIPFVCEPQNCEAGVGGKCVNVCELDEVCAPENGEVNVATGQTVGEDCKRPCESEIDCFTVGKCEGCVDGFCKTRCDPMQCELPCDGAGNCPSRCTENQQCVDGECRTTCFDDRDCDARRCESCQDGVCAFGCSEGQVCTLLGCGGPGCTRQSDCPACHVCAATGNPAEGACVPCEQAGFVCRDDRCRYRCDEERPCAACERCEEGACVNDCPDGQVCDPVDEVCRSGCASDAECSDCELCLDIGYGDPFCIGCEEVGNCLECNSAGRCQSRCDVNACERCVSFIAGACLSRCNPETEKCDGMGNCVPQ